MLVAFDFDGTLSDSEMIVLLAEEAGAADAVATVTERAMNDEIDYATSLRERAALLEGLDGTAVDRAYEGVRLREGAGSLIAALRAAGHHVAILTGGFAAGVERALAAADVTVDTVIANRLPVADGTLTGTVEGPLIEGTKDDALRELADETGTDLSGTVAVGDGANDRPMLAVAGLAVGYAPKPAVGPVCDVVVESMAELRALFEDRNLL